MKPSGATKTTLIGIDVGFQYTKAAIAFPHANRVDRQFKAMKVTWQDTDSSGLLPTLVERYGDTHEWFKLRALSPGKLDQSGGLSGDMSQTLAQDYLVQFLRESLVKISAFYEKYRIDNRYLPQWQSAEVEFIFSVPSVTSAAGALNLKRAAELAGFRSLDGKHKVLDIKLSEAEASAIYAIRDLNASLAVKPGERILVLDVGGGTSDVTMAIAMEDGTCHQDQIVLCPVTSEKLGGAYIDNAIAVIIQKIFTQVGMPPDDARNEAQRICRSKEYRMKKEDRAEVNIKVRALQPFDKRLDGSESGGIGLFDDRLEIAPAVFDDHLDTQLYGPGSRDTLQGGILEQIITMRDDLFQRTPSDSKEYKMMYGEGKAGSSNIDAVVFAGGVCRSEHLQERIRHHLRRVPDSQSKSKILATVADTKFLCPKELQHSVCMGLVYARIQAIDAKEGRQKETYFGWIGV